MFKKTKRMLEIIEPVDAQRLRENSAFDIQRPVRETHVDMLAEEMRKGRFLTGDIGLAVLNRKIHLVNGQHTILAVERSGVNIEAVVSWYDCETKDDLSDLFRRYDNNLSRSLRDVSIVEANALGFDWKPRIVQLVVTGASMKSGLYHKASTKNRKAELLKLFKSHGDFLIEILDPWQMSKHLRRGAIVHAVFETFDINKEDAYVFWDNVKTGEKLSLQDPEKLLRDWLMGVSFVSGRPSDREVFARCITAWNNFRKRNKLKILKYNSGHAVPKAI